MFQVSVNSNPIKLSCVSHSTDICTVAIRNIRNMHAVSTNQIGDILHFNDKARYLVQHGQYLHQPKSS